MRSYAPMQLTNGLCQYGFYDSTPLNLQQTIILAHMSTDIWICLPFQKNFDHHTVTLTGCKHKRCEPTLCEQKSENSTMYSCQNNCIQHTSLMRFGLASLCSSSITTCSCPYTTAISKGVHSWK